MDNSLPYRTPFVNSTSVTSASVADVLNYDSLVAVHTEMGKAMANLLTINSIDVNATELKVKQQIVANQKAYDILLPIYQSLETAIGDVKAKQEQRY